MFWGSYKNNFKDLFLAIGFWKSQELFSYIQKTTKDSLVIKKIACRAQQRITKLNFWLQPKHICLPHSAPNISKFLWFMFSSAVRSSGNLCLIHHLKFFWPHLASNDFIIRRQKICLQPECQATLYNKVLLPQIWKSCWQPELSGWIQATMQQNTISTNVKTLSYFCLQDPTRRPPVSPPCSPHEARRRKM